MSSAEERAEMRALKLSAAVYVLVFALKLAVYLNTGVMALLAEAFHTLSDLFLSGFLLLAAVVSRREPDEGHMFGHGRAQNVGALVAATLFVSFTSFKLYEEAIPRLFQPHEATYQNLPLAVGVLIFSMLIASVPLVDLLRQKKRGAAAKAQMVELVNDQLGLVAALAGTLFVSMGQPLADPIATVLVATIIAVNALGLFRENLSYLLGRSPGREFLAKVEKIALGVPGVRGIHGVRAEYIGPDSVHAGLHIEVPSDLSVVEANRIADEVSRQLQAASGCRYCVIHVDPVDPDKPAARPE